MTLLWCCNAKFPSWGAEGGHIQTDSFECYVLLFLSLHSLFLHCIGITYLSHSQLIPQNFIKGFLYLILCNRKDSVYLGKNRNKISMASSHLLFFS